MAIMVNNLCPRCEGRRIQGELFQSCPACAGSGIVNPSRNHPYYVIWFNTARKCLELHKPFCEHGLDTQNDYFSLGGDNIDPKLLPSTLPTNYKMIALMVEDCLS